MKRKCFSLLAFLFLGVMGFATAQELDENSYNFNSVRPIRRADIMFQRSIWREMDLREKINEPFFAKDNQISKLIIDAVKAGVLRPFQNDSLTTRMSLQEFLDNLKVPGTAPGGEGGDFGGGDEFGGGGDWGGGGGDWGGGGGGDWGGGGGGDEKKEEKKEAANDEFFPKQIYLIRIKEDLIYDKKRSRIYHDIQSIQLVISGEQYPTGLDKTLATFSYKELVDNVFKDNPAAMWYNSQNMGELRNLQDAFDLRLLNARIFKYSNPRDELIVDIYSGNEEIALGKSMEYEHRLVEYESNTWSN